MRRLLLALAVLLVALPVATASARSSLVSVPVSGPLTVPTLERLGFDVTHDVTERRAIVVLHDAADRAALADAGYPSEEVVADLGALHRRSRAADAARDASRLRSGLPSGRDTYRILADYTRELDTLSRQHPGLVRRVDLPRRSVQGRPLAGVEIAGDVNRDDDGRPAYVVMGAHHAREWPSAEVSMEFALDLARNAADPRVAAILDRVRIFVFPVINPDGFVMSRGEDPLLPFGPDRLQRKNAAEVDLNRNYGAFWGGNGASTDPADDTFRGSGPWSEPESVAVHEFSQRLHITNFQSIHNIASLVLRPPGFKALGLAPDEERLKALGDRMAAAAGYASEYGYQLYEVTGATEDWNYVAQNAFGYTIELGGSSIPGDFQGTYQTHVVDQYLGADGSAEGRDGVREALLLAGEQAGDPRDHAIVEGTARPGATLRLAKRFDTTTSPICADDGCATTTPAILVPDGLDTTLRVPASGRYSWHVNPSTRPFVRKAGGTEAWTLTCEDGGRVLARQELVIALGERRTVNPCGPAASSPPPPAPATTTTRRLRLSLRGTPRRQRLATVLRRGLLVRARCNRACRLKGVVRRRPGTRLLGVRRTKRGKAGVARFRVRLSRAGRRAVVRRRVRAVAVRVRARDSLGVVRRHRVAVRLVGPRRQR